jgi:hypothetical protein
MGARQASRSTARMLKVADGSRELLGESLGGLQHGCRERAALSEMLVVLIGCAPAARVVPSHALRVDPVPDVRAVNARRTTVATKLRSAVGSAHYSTLARSQALALSGCHAG